MIYLTEFKIRSVGVLTETRSQGMNKVNISHKGRKYKNVLNVGLKNAMTELKSR